MTSRFFALNLCGRVALGAAALTITICSAKADPEISHTFPPPEDLRKPDLKLLAGRGPAAAIAYDDNGRLLAVAGGDYAIRIWDARPGEATGQLLKLLKGHTDRVLALAFGANSNELISASADQTIRRWNLATGALLGRIDIKLDGEIHDATFHPGQRPILAVAVGENVELWDCASGWMLKRFAPYNNGRLPERVAFSPDGRVLGAGSSKGGIMLWNAETGAAISGAWSGTTWEVSVQSLTLGTNVVAAGCGDGLVRMWNFRSGWAAGAIKAGDKAITAVAFSGRGEQIASASGDRIVKVWDTQSSALLCSQVGHSGKILAIAFSPNGQKMASSDLNGGVNYWTVPLPLLSPDDLAKIDAALPGKATAKTKVKRKILVFWRADAILHKGGVPAANHAIEGMARKTGAFAVDFTRDYDAFNPTTLANYDAIVMNSTAHLAMPESARRAYLDFVNRGGGVVGIHAAIDTFRDWPEGAKVIGATFGNHPWHPTGTWAVKLEEPKYPLLRAWGGVNFKMHDEFYEMADPYTRADRKVLLSVDLSDPATAGVSGLRRKDGDFALSWIKHYGQGKVFYCVFGHIVEPFQNPAVLRYYLDGIQYTLGDLKVDDSLGPKKP